MTRYFLITILVLSFSTIKAQKDKEAQEVLDKMAEKVLDYKTIKTGFVFHVTNPETEIDERYKGTVLIKDNKYRMKVDGTISISDGKSRWVYLEESNEVNVSDVISSEDLSADERFMNDPLALFTLFKDGFKFNLSGTEKLEGKEYMMVDISPEDLDKPYFKIRYWVSPEYDVKKIKYFQKDGTRIVLEFEDFETDVKAKESEFDFNEKDYPGVEVIDLRE